MVFRVYEFAAKADIPIYVDLIGAVGINSNTLINALVLLRYDGLVQSSAIELLGLEDWWKQGRRQEKIIITDINMAKIPKKDDAKNDGIRDGNYLATVKNDDRAGNDNDIGTVKVVHVNVILTRVPK